MRPNRKKQNTNSEPTREKHACPKTASIQYQGTGNKRFDSKTQKPTGPGPEIDIITGLSSAATPGLHCRLEDFDPEERKILSTILSEAHYAVVQTILSLLDAKGVPVSSLDGESLRITIRFVKNIPEEP